MQSHNRRIRQTILKQHLDKRNLLTSISQDFDVVTITDLERITTIASLEKSIDEALSHLAVQQQLLLDHDAAQFLDKIQHIVNTYEADSSLIQKGLLTLLLSLRDPSLFDHEPILLNCILCNDKLINLLMIECGKALIADTSNDDIIDLLIAYGANINSADSDGMTALHHACKSFYLYRDEPLHLIDYLIQNGANPSISDSNGKMAIDIAHDLSHMPAVRLLQSHNIAKQIKPIHSTLFASRHKAMVDKTPADPYGPGAIVIYRRR